MSVNPIPPTTEVAIVGAGPVGMTVAIALADAGVDFVLLDKISEGANTSRACVVHARTLEVLSEFGISATLIERGEVVDTFVLHDGRHELAELSFADLPTDYPFALLVPQEITEEVLLERLRKVGGEVARPYEVTAVTQDADGATLTYTDSTGTTGTLAAHYVVGADGMHSVVREQAGIGFTGSTYPESFVLADIRMTWPEPRQQVGLHLDPQGVTVVAPLPDPDGMRYRVVATVDEAPEKPDLEHVQQLLDARGPAGEITVHELLWSSRFRVHHRVADTYRAGRVFVAGDAAHVHSPAGGQGMNTGIQDAAVLGRLLSQVLGGQPDTLLDDYESTRRPVATDVVKLTDRMTRVATLSPKPARAVRNTLIGLATRIPAVRRDIAYTLSELGYR
ncbi:FAD-dependent monooxygenase [Nocardia sp. NBC_00511]|uniref:FAD-dependent monooxygenase n=1 Tax=Nocardia sp. NBC_00511 TaxID=2903591 RepID=UPI0030E5DBC4